MTQKKKGEKPKRVGRKPHMPTDKDRRMVESMKAFGILNEDIAKVIGIDADTLAKHYRAELDTALIKANSKVASKLFEKAMTGDTACMMFWLKTRAKWKENHDDKAASSELVNILGTLIGKLPS